MTDHRHFEEVLADFALGSLREGQQEDVRAHLETCPDCREWVGTYRDLAAAVGSSSPVVSEHPSSEALAGYAVDRSGLPDPEQLLISSHLDKCPSCALDVELSERAIVSAREKAGGSEPARERDRAVPVRSGSAHGLRKRLALAATVLVAVATASVLMLSPWSTGNGDVELASGSLTGEKLVESDGAITATGVSIEAESTVDFKAGDKVVLANGFSVAEGASFSVELTGDHDDSSEREPPTP